MITTARSLTVGAVAWLLAFLAVLFCRIDIAFNTQDAILIGISYAVGLSAVIALGRRYCRHDFERGNAVMVFSLGFFAAIYAPIAAIWANAPLYKWVAPLAAKPKSYLLSRYLAPAVEHTACSHYIGGALLLIGGWLIARCIARKTPNQQYGLGRPRGPDVAFGIATLLGALEFDPDTVNSLRLLGYVCGAFLFSLLFRSIRLQWRSLHNTPPPTPSPPISRWAGLVTVLCLWLGWPLCTLVGFRFKSHQYEWVFGLGTVGCLLPWAFLRFFMRGRSEALSLAREDAGAFAMRCGFWGGMALSLVLAKLVLVGLAEKIMNSTPDVVTPFATSVLALRPIYPLFAASTFMVGMGGFIIPAILPSTTRASQRMVTCAHGGAVLLLVGHMLMTLFAINLTLLTVSLIPIGKPLVPEVTTYFVPGNWYKLSLYNLELLVFAAAGGALFWALKASIVCGLISLKDRFLPKPSITDPIASPPPVMSPPPTPSA